MMSRPHPAWHMKSNQKNPGRACCPCTPPSCVPVGCFRRRPRWVPWAGRRRSASQTSAKAAKAAEHDWKGRAKRCNAGGGGVQENNTRRRVPVLEPGPSMFGHSWRSLFCSAFFPTMCFCCSSTAASRRSVHQLDALLFTNQRGTFT